MSTDDSASARRPGWEVTLANLAADAVLADAALYAGGGRRVTVEHGQRLTGEATALLRQLVDQVDARPPGPATSAAAPSRSGRRRSPGRSRPPTSQPGSSSWPPGWPATGSTPVAGSSPPTTTPDR